MSQFDNPPVVPPQIPNYLIASIFLTLCCCPPLGIPAIVFSSMSSSHLASGNYAAALDSANKAKLFFWLGLGLGLAGGLAYMMLMGFAAIADLASSGN